MEKRESQESESNSKLANVSQNWLNVLVPLSNDYSVKKTASQISKEQRIPQRTAARKLDQLSSLGLIEYTRVGKNKSYYINLNKKESIVLLNLIESYKSLYFLNLKTNILPIIKDLMNLGTIIIFGSYAKGKEKKDSDLDILILGKKKKIIGKIISKYDLVINYHFSTIGSFSKLLKEKNNLSVEIAKSHIIFGNSSNFIELLKRYYNNEL